MFKLQLHLKQLPSMHCHCTNNNSIKGFPNDYASTYLLVFSVPCFVFQCWRTSNDHFIVHNLANCLHYQFLCFTWCWQGYFFMSSRALCEFVINYFFVVEWSFHVVFNKSFCCCCSLMFPWGKMQLSKAIQCIHSYVHRLLDPKNC